MNSIAKRCSTATILVLVATLPQFDQLKTSQAGLMLIANFEGCQLTAYQCDADIWTRGIGHTLDVLPGQTVTRKRVAKDFLADVRHVERGMAVCLPADMPQEIYDAVIAFAFNVGVHAACHSTMMRFLQQRQWHKACNQLPRWVYVLGIKSKGLERRRAAERTLCLRGARRAAANQRQAVKNPGNGNVLAPIKLAKPANY
ncbi:glycoside hydrolase [Gibbsiella quercinecans]|nr:glycoside hydrolase [Gibbsiella quercinecans]